MLIFDLYYFVVQIDILAASKVFENIQGTLNISKIVFEIFNVFKLKTNFVMLTTFGSVYPQMCMILFYKAKTYPDTLVVGGHENELSELFCKQTLHLHGF